MQVVAEIIGMIFVSCALTIGAYKIVKRIVEKKDNASN